MTEQEKLKQAIQAQEALRATLGDAVVDTTIATLRDKLVALEEANQAQIKQRKYITVLFADVSGFTQLSETRDAEDVGNIMQALWQRMDPIIVHHGGLIDKHIGDAVMALFGAPTAQENDAERAVRAALAMQAEVKAFCEEHHLALAMRIGINSGQVILDVVGTTREYTAMGDEVNVASRMETAAPVGGVLISQQTYLHVQGLFDVEPLPLILVKGKSDPMQTYVVHRAIPHVFEGATRGLEGVQQQMIGRDQQLRALQDAFDTVVAEKQLQMITIVGEVGLGKTRLLEEFSQWLTAETPLTWYLKGRTTHTSPYALIRNLFAMRFDIREEDSLAVVRQKLEQGVMALLGEEGLAWAHFIGRLIGYDFADSPYVRGLADDAQQVYEQALHGIVLMLRVVAAQQPVAIFLEDAHWADEASLDFVMEVALRCQQLPLLMVTLARPSLYEKRPYWGEGRSFHMPMELLPLSRRDSQRFVSNILHQLQEQPPSPVLRDLIVASAEGNPFYMEELVRMFREEGTLTHYKEGQDVRVPPTLFGVLQARLDRLEHEAEATIQQASVVGRVFWDKAVDHLRQQEQATEADLTSQFDHMRQRRLIEMRVPSTFADAHEYRFHNSLLRDTAYEAVLIELRRRYHRLVAGWLVAKYGPARVIEQVDEIASHYEQAGIKEEAATWYGRAGDQAAETYALTTAVRYYEKALMLSVAAASEYRLPYYRGLGKVRRMQAQYDEALAAFQEMQKLANDLGDDATEAEAWNFIAFMQALQAKYEISWQSANTAESLARRAGAPAMISESLLRQGWNAYRLNQNEVALTKAHEALQISEQLGDARQTAVIRHLLLAVHVRVGHHAQARQYGQEAQAVFRSLGDKRSLSVVLSGTGNVAEEQGDWESALRDYDELRTIALETGNVNSQMLALYNMGQLNVKMAAWETAVTYLQQLLAMPESTQAAFLSLAQAALAQAYLGQQELTDALAVARQALQTAQARNHPYFLGTAWQTLAQVLAQLPDPPTLTDLNLSIAEDKLFLPVHDLKTTAAFCFAHSAAIFDGVGMKQEQMAVLEAWAEHEGMQGDVAMSHQLQEQVSRLWWQLYEEKKETAVLATPPPEPTESSKKAAPSSESETETTTSWQPISPSGIPAELNTRLRHVLLNCAPFASHLELQAIFVDARIHLWHNHLPEAGTTIGRVEAVTDFLFHQHNAAQENGLVLFLQVLSERLQPDDACWQELTSLARALSDIFNM